MKKSMIALVVAAFAMSSVAFAAESMNEPAARSQTAAVKKHKKSKKKAKKGHKKAETTEAAPAAPAAEAAPAAGGAAGH